MNPVEIGASALNVEWQRLEIIAENLANMNSASAVGSDDAYSPQRLISHAAQSFSQIYGDARVTRRAFGSQVANIQVSDNPHTLKFEPDHPLANENGLVQYPNIDHAYEMTQLMKTSRAYEANLVSISIIQQMYSKALQMGG
ncbi:flagellar basal body rod protein FlgC [Woodsholea maritima]|uniref:flagellar basal body rod protein FlgC n=1 Tax=Woodsholea maritima TaxID=240237 RepID=UPI0003703FB4|nr:flagellar basal body rod protein FlgC [Woodsholea maritima]